MTTPEAKKRRVIRGKASFAAVSLEFGTWDLELADCGPALSGAAYAFGLESLPGSDAFEQGSPSVPPGRPVILHPDLTMKKPATVARPAGFTLVELMVVVVIIIILAAATFAISTRVLTHSRLNASLGKVRDLGVRIENYTRDNGGDPARSSKDNSQDPYWWGLLVKDPRNESEPHDLREPGPQGI